jgi:hypothetical protein
MKRTALNTTAAATATDVSALNYVAGSGTAQAQAATLATAITSLTNGLNVCWLPAAANTGAAPTLALNGLTPKPLTKYGAAALVANDLTTAAIACAIYDGTEFQLQNPQTFPGSVKINGGTAIGPQPTLNLIPGTGLAGFIGVLNGSQIDVTLPIDTSYLNTNYARLAAANSYSGGGLQDMNAMDLRLPVHSSDPGTCSVGQIEFNSAGATFKGCSTTNTWSGVPSIMASGNTTGQSTSLGTVTLANAPTAGQYTLTYYADQNAVCTTGSNSVSFTFNWTDATSARSVTTGPLTLAAAQTASSFLTGLQPIWVGSGNVTYSSTVSGTCATGTSTYDVHVTLIREQ